MTTAERIKSRFSRSNLIELFLAVAFPIHAWSIFGVLRDVDTVVNRTDAWDAVGVGAYSLVFAFIETSILLLFFMILSLLLPFDWGERKIKAEISGLYYVFAFWAVCGQAFFMFKKFPPLVERGIRFIQANQWPFFVLLIIIVIASFLLPLWRVYASKKAEAFVLKVNENVMLLSILYIFLDLIGFVIMVIRNIA